MAKRSTKSEPTSETNMSLVRKSEISKVVDAIKLNYFQEDKQRSSWFLSWNWLVRI